MHLRLNMRRRRERSGQKVLSGYLRCDACGKRFSSGVIRLEVRYLIEARCNQCASTGRQSLDMTLEQAFDPSFKRRTIGRPS
jgi:hypothetical protein